MPNNDLSSVIPANALRAIRDHFDERITRAVENYAFNEDDEDSLTGALGQALITKRKQIAHDGHTLIELEITAHKIRGKGPGAPERWLGADGIFQVSVSNFGHSIFDKGLPFQAKKTDSYSPTGILPQARNLFATSGSGIILRFGQNCYEAQDVRHLIGASKDVATPKGFHSLASVLGDWFLKCQVGKLGLSYDKHLLCDPPDEYRKGGWVFSTILHRKAVD